MKLFKYGLPFAALALLASCSNDAPLSEGPAQLPNPSELLTDGTMYTTIKIGMPKGNSTRASFNDQFDEGIATEYQVKTGTLLVFLGDGTAANEDQFPFLTAGTITFKDWDPTVTPNTHPDTGDTDPLHEITSTETEATVVIPGFNKDAIGAQFYGLVVLNGDFAENKTDGKLTLPAEGDKFGDWKKEVFKNGTDVNVMMPTLSGTKYFTMSNAPQYVSGNAITLINLDKSKIFKTTEFAAKKEAGEATTAGTFYVQRGVAKVKVGVKDGETFSAFPVSNEEGYYTGATVDLTNWMLDLTNTKTFPVQVYDFGFADSELGKFSGSHFYYNSNVFKRLWWGEDPNYYSYENGDFVNNSTYKVANTATGQEATLYDYCLENTMTFGKQFQDQTTRVVFKAIFKLADNDAGTSFIVYNNVAMPVDSEDIKYDRASGSEMPNSGQYLLSELIAPDVPNSNPEGQESNEVKHLSKYVEGLGAVDGLVLVNYYKGGECYYTGRIRHFDDTETAWTAAFQKDFEDAYNEDKFQVYEADQLGRYGVLRNNVYELTVNSISGPGDPTFPTPDPNDPDPDDPTDPNYKFIIDLNILSWAKRSQSLDW